MRAVSSLFVKEGMHMSKERKHRDTKTRMRQWVIELVAVAVARRVIRNIVRKL